MVFHVGNAHETADDHVVLSYIGWPDAWFLDQGAVALMSAKPSATGHVSTQFATLDMKTGKARGTTFDARRQATVLNVLDAGHIADGPIAQAVLPYMLPLGFHGNFTAV